MGRPKIDKNHGTPFIDLPCFHFSATPCYTVSGPEANKKCIFPFVGPSSGQLYEGCTNEDYDQYWCRTNLTTGTWGNCGPDCKKEETGITFNQVINVK